MTKNNRRKNIGPIFGTEPEPRPGMRSGHIPGSVNLPFGQLLSLEDKTSFSASEIENSLRCN